MWDRLLKPITWLTGYQPRVPDRLVVETTNRCNCNCPICGASQSITAMARGDMPWDMVAGLAEQAAQWGCRGVYLHSRGEPLLHPRNTDIVREFARHALDTHLCTNGVKLTADGVRELVDAGLDWLTISHPGVSPANYEACRGVPQAPGFDARLAGALAAWHAAGKAAVVRLLVLPARVEEGADAIGRFLDYWLSLPGVASVELTSYEPWPRHVREDLLRFVHSRPRPCALAAYCLTVLYDGSITPCSYDVQGELTIGNWPAVSLPDAFNGRAMRQMRRRSLWRSASRPGICRSCLLMRTSSPRTVAASEDLAALSGDSRAAWLRGTSRTFWNAVRK